MVSNSRLDYAHSSIDPHLSPAGDSCLWSPLSKACEAGIGCVFRRCSATCCCKWTFAIGEGSSEESAGEAPHLVKSSGQRLRPTLVRPCGGGPLEYFEVSWYSGVIMSVGTEEGDLLENTLPLLTSQGSCWDKLKWPWPWLRASSTEVQGQAVARKSTTGRLCASFLFFYFFILNHRMWSFWGSVLLAIFFFFFF